jgi:hypothetical protein
VNAAKVEEPILEMRAKENKGKSPVSTAMEFLNLCQNGTNSLIFSGIGLTNNDASVV